MTRKPSESEEEYFARIEFERRKRAEQEKQNKLAAEEKETLRKRHHMKCPKCGMDLIELDYKSLKVDRCSGCDGVWLDPGELEAVVRMEKSMLGRIFGG
ncbi:MAG TPA: zf-TFIIB domain-containing protein [Candidatus Deferrimicrobiaceae bacterium]